MDDPDSCDLRIALRYINLLNLTIIDTVLLMIMKIFINTVVIFQSSSTST